MRALAGLALVLALAACGPPQGPPAAPEPPPAATAACNDVMINPARRAQLLAAVAEASSLLGGPIAPGLYDLVSIEPREGAPAPEGDLWESVRVRDTDAGIMLDFAIVRGAPSNSAHHVNAQLTEGQQAALVHVCGASGRVPVSYAASADGLQLLLPAEGGAGQMLYSFVRRAV